MEKEFVPYEPSLVLKELGFDEPCFGVYLIQSKEFVLVGSTEKIRPKSKNCNAPTFSQAFRWFREKYEIYSSINSFHCVNSIKPFGLQIDYFVKGIWNYYETNDETNFITYEEAELECLVKLIEIVKTK